MLLDLLFLTQSQTAAVAGDERGAPALEVGTFAARASLQGGERGAPAATADAMTVRVALSGAERGAPGDETGTFLVVIALSGAEQGAPALEVSSLTVTGIRTFFGLEQASAAQDSSVYTALNLFRGSERGAPARETSTSTVLIRFTGSDHGASAAENLAGKGDIPSTIRPAEYEALGTCVRAETGYVTIFTPSLAPSTVVARLVRLGFIELKEDRTARPASRWGYVATASGKAIYLEIKHRREALGDQGYNYFGVT